MAAPAPARLDCKRAGWTASDQDGIGERRIQLLGGSENRMKTWIARALAKTLTSPGLRDFRRSTAAAVRRWSGRRAVVTYFHQIDDPYSQLTAQLLAPFAARYDVDLVCQLVSPPSDAAAPERARLEQWSCRDAALLARRLGLDWPDHPAAIDPALRSRVADMLAGAGPAFATLAPQLGQALWRGRADEVETMTASAAAGAGAAAMRQGDAVRATLGHYLGATFHFEGEWYWALDRLHLLEDRLTAAGLRRAAGSGALAPVADVRLAGPSRPVGSGPTLDFFLSLRSPYTYLAVPRVRALAQHYGATLRLRFILPMVMRGLPVPTPKRLYIVRDCKREAERLGLPFGDIVDPVGRGVERGLAVLHLAVARGQGPEFLWSFLRGVWSEGIDAADDAGLTVLAERAGIDRATVAAALADDSWRVEAEANRQEMFGLGLWGPPSFRVNDGPAYWGQDRLWAVEDDLIKAG